MIATAVGEIWLRSPIRRLTLGTLMGDPRSAIPPGATTP
jgi:hypothetical protein